jgi:hypothetical protein
MKKQDIKLCSYIYSSKYYEQIRLEYINGEDDYGDEYIDEICGCCGIHMNDVNDIFVDVEDRYVCGECVDTYGIDVVRCKEY